MFRGIMGTKRQKYMKDMVENFIYLFNKYDIIPNSNLAGLMNRSQPPFLTSMILDVYRTPHMHSTFKKHLVKVLSPLHDQKNRQWLHEAIEVAKKEYMLVWLDVEGAYNHKVSGYSLAKYGDRDIGYAHSSELESGWDMTSRFYNRCNEFLPIDLNVYLYKYERDFALVAPWFQDTMETSNFWHEAAATRKDAINTYMWNEKEGFFFDYGYKYERQSDFLSLAGFTPLWARLATPKQAAKMVKKLKKFETPHGLTITAKESLARPIDLSTIQKRYHPALHDIIDAKQWDYPNIWSIYEYLTVIGLLQYGYVDDAVRLMKKTLTTGARMFRKYGTFFEKADGETGDKVGDFHYPSQEGFGWTNAVFYRFVMILNAIEQGEEIYVTPKAKETPYELAILH